MREQACVSGHAFPVTGVGFVLLAHQSCGYCSVGSDEYAVESYRARSLAVVEESGLTAPPTIRTHTVQQYDWRRLGWVSHRPTMRLAMVQSINAFLLYYYYSSAVGSGAGMQWVLQVGVFRGSTKKAFFAARHPTATLQCGAVRPWKTRPLLDLVVPPPPPAARAWGGADW